MLLPLHARAFRSLRVPRFARLVLSSDASLAKAVRVPAGARHVCYCHSPPRYLWDMLSEYTEYARDLGPFGRFLFKFVAATSRKFDYQAAQGVDHFIANSRFVAERIQKCYGRESMVVYPPVAVDDFTPDKQSAGFYLVVGHIVPYKRVDLAVTACTMLGRNLVVVGEGSELDRLKRIAGPTVEFLGRQPFAVVKNFMECCRAFLYPQVEDFGITAVEAQAAGRPVIAYRKGGALETVIEGSTGLFFEEQTPKALADAICRFESEFEGRYDPRRCRANAERFRPERFRTEIKTLLTRWYPELFRDYCWPDVGQDAIVPLVLGANARSVGEWPGIRGPH
nr:glycosyltransferase [Opitutus terrae]